ncbi:hypothetical protein PPL_10412 [Heterostelium album PN500]|uniref:Uncharacterized protein n=1 Tax=Heterostelium pallidum (strain ATCC 26659 / Pp 5 / PN500) TaxID=670386 RepID=D3BR09_HETP5|nr:hypothetical protein PPL_10412 [Heterostelium album PN500]EFA76195.1 hypothetical protein PPL_10412 [Heterostelium album PN500]|eukprot:XP_020428328.1 hypothetical protein PPL_10412 [Heterostelium album PN500]
MNEKNKEHLLVNLPLLLLSHIINRIPDNLDRICWSLVCKRWFDNRDKYIWFNTDEISLMSNNNSTSSFHLQSYKSIYLKSIGKRECTLGIGSITLYNPKYDYSIDNQSFHKLKSIPSNVTTVILKDAPRLNPLYKNVFNDSPPDSEHLCRLLLQSPNVKELRYCRTLKYRLPDSIQKLSICLAYGEKMTANNIPRQVQSISLNCNFFDRPFTRDVSGNQNHQVIEPGVLPTSLKHLYLGYGSIQLHPESLPANLEVLQIGRVAPPTGLLLPNTLHTILEISSCWTPMLMTLPHLTTLSLRDSTRSLVINELPPTLTDLSFSGDYQLNFEMPPTITHLDLSNCRFEYYQIFPVTSNYRLEVLTTTKLPKQQQTNVHISKLVFQCLTLGTLTPGIIPAGIESLDLSMSINNISVGSIPESVKHLSLNMVYESYQDVIPETVETLQLHRTDSLTTNIIPKTLKTLIIPFSKSTLQFIPRPLPPKIIFRETDLQHASHIRKLDHQYYLLFGKPMEEFKGMFTSERQPAFHFTTAIFHESKFIDLLSRHANQFKTFDK